MHVDGTLATDLRNPIIGKEKKKELGVVGEYYRATPITNIPTNASPLDDWEGDHQAPVFLRS